MEARSGLTTVAERAAAPSLSAGGAQSRRLRVLMVASSFPFPPASGFDMRNSQIARQMSRRHDVTLLTYYFPREPPAIGDLPAGMNVRVVRSAVTSEKAKRIAQIRSVLSPMPFACLSVRSEQMQDAIDELTAEAPFDLIHLESSTMSCFKFPDGIPIVVDEHNVDTELFARLYRGESAFVRRLFNGLEYVRTRRFEQACWRRVAACAVTSEREEPTVRAVAVATPIAVVPNGVDLEYFAPSDGETKPCTAVFTGVLNYRPNIDAAMHLVHEVWPIVQRSFPDATLTLVGHAPEREAELVRRPGVVVAGHVPDVRPYLRDACVVVVPVRYGRRHAAQGRRSSLAREGDRVTTLGCEGIATQDREHLLIADDAETFAAKIVELFKDQDLRVRLGEAGRALAESGYSWDVAGERMNDRVSAGFGEQLSEHRAGERLVMSRWSRRRHDVGVPGGSVCCWSSACLSPTPRLASRSMRDGSPVVTFTNCSVNWTPICCFLTLRGGHQRRGLSGELSANASASVLRWRSVRSACVGGTTSSSPTPRRWAFLSRCS